MNQTPTPPQTEQPKSYKVGVKGRTCTEWAYNALRFKSKDDAEQWGRDLYARWTGCHQWEVHPSDDEPNK